MPRKIVAFLATVLVLTLLATACNKSGGATPMATAKAFYDAAKAKDVQGMKNALSKKSLAMMEELAKMGNKTLDESLKEPDPARSMNFEARNEKITGDTATIEVKDEKGKWEPLPFVKEDGQWKIALDQAFEKAMQQLDKEIQAPTPASPAASPEKKEDAEKTEGEQTAPEGEHTTPDH